jgi:TRAP-type C4-dicarboxylate transport system permease small subunit
MIDLVLDLLHLTERRLLRRLARTALAVLVPLMLLAGALVWASVAAFLALSQAMAPHYAALAVTGGSLAVALLIAGLSRLPRRRRPRQVTLDRILAELLTGNSGKDDLTAELAAILVLAEDLMSRHGRQPAEADG